MNTDAGIVAVRYTIPKRYTRTGIVQIATPSKVGRSFKPELSNTFRLGPVLDFNIGRETQRMSGNNPNPQETFGRLENIDSSELRDELVSYIAYISTKDQVVATTFVLILKLLSDAITGVYQGRQENLIADLRACVDEAAKDYAEYETTELKRRIDQVFIRYDRRMDRHDEALKNIQEIIRGGIVSSDST